MVHWIRMNLNLTCPLQLEASADRQEIERGMPRATGSACAFLFVLTALAFCFSGVTLILLG